MSRDANRIRDEAADVHSQAVAYGEETRASADAYADEIRRRADADAAETAAEAERRSRDVHAKAVRGAYEVERAALLRQEALARDARQAEERAATLLSAFRSLTEQLETFASTAHEAPGVEPAVREHSRGTWSSLLWLFVGTTLGGIAALLVLLDADPAYRAPVTLAFVLVCPGLALVRLLGISGVVDQLALGIALSLALGVLVPAMLLAAGAWSPRAAISILVGITAAAAVVEVFVKPSAASVPVK